MSSMTRQRHDRRRAHFFWSSTSPVHSAHVGQELEVQYRWHAYFGCKVGIRRIAQRATGRFLSIMSPAGVVVTIADWMLDPVICAGMPMGTPRVDLAVLVELRRLLMGARHKSHDTPSDQIRRTAVGAGCARCAIPDSRDCDHGLDPIRRAIAP